MPEHRDRPETTPRGQTSIDFVFGALLFVAGVSVLIATAGGYFTSDLVDNADTRPQAEYAADYTATTLLAESNTSVGGALNSSAVAELLAGGSPNVADIPLRESTGVRVIFNHTGTESPPSMLPTGRASTAPRPDAAVISDAQVTVTIEAKPVTMTVETWPCQSSSHPSCP